MWCQLCNFKSFLTYVASGMSIYDGIDNIWCLEYHFANIFHYLWCQECQQIMCFHHLWYQGCLCYMFATYLIYGEQFYNMSVTYSIAGVAFQNAFVEYLVAGHLIWRNVSNMFDVLNTISLNLLIIPGMMSLHYASLRWLTSGTSLHNSLVTYEVCRVSFCNGFWIYLMHGISFPACLQHPWCLGWHLTIGAYDPLRLVYIWEHMFNIPACWNESPQCMCVYQLLNVRRLIFPWRSSA